MLPPARVCYLRQALCSAQGLPSFTVNCLKKNGATLMFLSLRPSSVCLRLFCITGLAEKVANALNAFATAAVRGLAPILPISRVTGPLVASCSAASFLIKVKIGAALAASNEARPLASTRRSGLFSALQHGASSAGSSIAAGGFCVARRRVTSFHFFYMAFGPLCKPPLPAEGHAF